MEGKCYRGRLFVGCEKVVGVKQPTWGGQRKASNEDRVVAHFIEQHLRGCQLTVRVALQSYTAYQDRLVSCSRCGAAVGPKGPEKN